MFTLRLQVENRFELLLNGSQSETLLVVEHTCNDVYVVAGVFLARRGREVVPGYVERAQRGEGRTGVHPQGAPTSAHPRCWRLST